jgi:hypothetical protein
MGHTLHQDCRRCQPTETRFANLKKAALAAEVLAGRSARGNSAGAHLVFRLWQEIAERVVVRVGEITAAGAHLVFRVWQEIAERGGGETFTFRLCPDSTRPQPPGGGGGEIAERVVVRVGEITAATGTTPPTNAAAPAASGAARLLPAGTRVLVQRLARVLSYDARTGRYAVALDDGKELSLKAECVARAGCAAAGCASDEASSVCGRCEAVRYCSRECQRTDWKAHKPVCSAAQP